ncbi:MAG: sigma-70 family RNA polymerase sigma factor [Candidatus Peribacteria bacterium]|nr:MAG: sigma-70 family RNA polymerase sigma factor [Candidatus Peribacteria bacterium]
MYHISDTLMQELLQGSEDAFGVRYQETVDDFGRYVQVRYNLNTAQLEDTIAQFYMKMWDVFPTLSDDMDENRLYVYCWTVLNNMVKDFFKKKKDQTFSDFRLEEDNDDVALPLVSDDDVAELFAQQYAADAIMDALRALDIRLYDIFYLKYMEGYDYEEIGEKLCLTYDAVRQQHSRAIRALQAAFE